MQLAVGLFSACLYTYIRSTILQTEGPSPELHEIYLHWRCYDFGTKYGVLRTQYMIFNPCSTLDPTYPAPIIPHATTSDTREPIFSVDGLTTIVGRCGYGILSLRGRLVVFNKY